MKMDFNYQQYRYLYIVILSILDIGVIVVFQEFELNVFVILMSFIASIYILGKNMKVIDNKILEYSFFTKTNEYLISDINYIEIITINEVTSITVRIGKWANEIKESNYRILFTNGKSIVIEPSLMNKDMEPLGRYLIRKHYVKSRKITRDKYFNRHFY